MNALTENKLLELKEAIAADPRVKALEELEKKLSQDEEVLSLSKAKDEAERECNEVLRVFAAESVKAKEAQKSLFAAKLALDEHPLVKRYNAAFVAVKDLYLLMDDILFSSFRHPHSCGGKHA